jgi:hypothetical protein
MVNTNVSTITTFGVGVVSGSNQLDRGITALSVSMRSSPTVNFNNIRLYDGGSQGVVSSVNQNCSSTTQGSYVLISTGASLTTGRACMILEGASSGATAYLDFTAEL